MSRLEKIKEENRAFFIWAQKVYGEHPIGELLLAVYMYECCRKHPDAVTWDIMKAMGHATFNNESWVEAASEVLKT
jgi:hypothetical protein